jgi:hypothetical protein
MPASPTAAEPPGNIGRDVRTRTCLGYSGFAKPEAEHDHDAENDADDLVTGSVTPAAAAGAVVKPSPAAPAAAAHPAPPKPRRAAALVRKTAQPRPPRAPVRAPVKRNADLSGGASSAALHDHAPLTAPPSVGP